jgi:hypothetical protein
VNRDAPIGIERGRSDPAAAAAGPPALGGSPAGPLSPAEASRLKRVAKDYGVTEDLLQAWVQLAEDSARPRPSSGKDRRANDGDIA